MHLYAKHGAMHYFMKPSQHTNISGISTDTYGQEDYN